MLARAFRSLFARPAAAVQSGSHPVIPFPGHDEIAAGSAVLCRIERASCDALVASGMASAAGEETGREFNVAGRVPVTLRAESEHAAAGVAAGLAMSGLRAGGFASGGGVPFLHESLYAASGKRLPYVFNISCRGLGEIAGEGNAHDEYHAVADSGVVQMMAASVQEIADLNLIARRLAELSLTPALVGHDAAASTQAIESLQFPEDALIAAYLGDADDLIDSPTPAQAMVFGAQRRRVPASWDVDRPLVSGVVQNQDAYMQATAAQRPYFFEHLPALADACMDEYAQLTGRRYRRADAYRCADAEYLIVAMGSLAADAEAVVDHLRITRGLRVGVVNVRVFRPFPGDLVGHLLQGKRGVTVLERSTQPLAEDGPLLREVRACLAKCLENGAAAGSPYPAYAAYGGSDLPALFAGYCPPGIDERLPAAVLAAIDNMCAGSEARRCFRFAADGATGAGVLALADLSSLLALDAFTVMINAGADSAGVAAGLARGLGPSLGGKVKGRPRAVKEHAAFLAFAGEAIRFDPRALPVDVCLVEAADGAAASGLLPRLRRGATLLLSSPLPTPAAVWDSFPVAAQAMLVDRQIRLFALDAGRIAAEVADSAGLPQETARLRGFVLQGALIAAAGGHKPFDRDAAIARLGGAIDAQEQTQGQMREQGGAQSQHQDKDAAIAAASLAALRRGTTASSEIRQKALGYGRSDRLWEGLPTATAASAATPPALAPWRCPPASAAGARNAGAAAWMPERCAACGQCYVGCAEDAVAAHLGSAKEILAASLQASRQARLDAFMARVGQLQAQLEARLRLQLTETIDMGDLRRLLAVVDTLPAEALTLDAIATQLPGCAPLAAGELARSANVFGALRELQRTCAGDAATSVWHAPLFVDSSALALGICEGLMQQIAARFAAVRRAERLLAAPVGSGDQENAASEEFFRRFEWTQFTDEEWALCPPVVVVGDAQTLSDARLQSLSRLLMSGKPVKVLMLDDLGPDGSAANGKELGLIALAHRQAFVLQSTLAHREHLISGLLDGLNSRGPALFRVFAPPRTAPDGAAINVLDLCRQAVASRAFPLYRYDPQAASVISAALSIEGNPDIAADWLSPASGDAAEVLTAAAYAVADPRFVRHFSRLADDCAGELMPLADYLAIDAAEREGITPFLRHVDARRRPLRLGVSPAMIAFAEERLAFWRQLRSLAISPTADDGHAALLAQIRDELLVRAVGALA